MASRKFTKESKKVRKKPGHMGLGLSNVEKTLSGITEPWKWKKEMAIQSDPDDRNKESKMEGRWWCMNKIW